MIQPEISGNVLFNALLFSENLIKKFGDSIYDKLDFQGNEIHKLNIDALEKNIFNELIIEKKLKPGTKLTIETFPFQNSIIGLVKYYLQENQIIISISSHLNTQWSRFVRSKELCQIYIDFKQQDIRPDRFVAVSDNIYDLVKMHNENLSEISLTDEVLENNTHSEFLAFFLAVTLSFPDHSQSEFWKALYSDSSHQEKESNTNYDIAQLYGVPEFVAKFFLERILPYREKQSFKFIYAYIDNLKHELGLFLKPGIGLQITTTPYNNGILLKLHLEKENKRQSDELEVPVLSIQEALKKADLRIENNVGKEIAPKFKGTNILLSDSTIHIFKENIPEEWTKEKAHADVNKIISD